MFTPNHNKQCRKNMHKEILFCLNISYSRACNITAYAMIFHVFLKCPTVSYITCFDNKIKHCFTESILKVSIQSK